MQQLPSVSAVRRTPIAASSAAAVWPDPARKSAHVHRGRGALVDSEASHAWREEPSPPAAMGSGWTILVGKCTFTSRAHPRCCSFTPRPVETKGPASPPSGSDAKPCRQRASRAPARWCPRATRTDRAIAPARSQNRRYRNVSLPYGEDRGATWLLLMSDPGGYQSERRVETCRFAEAHRVVDSVHYPAPECSSPRSPIRPTPK